MALRVKSLITLSQVLPEVVDGTDTTEEKAEQSPLVHILIDPVKASLIEAQFDEVTISLQE